MTSSLAFRAPLKPQLVLSLPPLAAIALVAIYVTVESVRPGGLTQPRPETISEAVVVGNGPRVLEMMAEGLDVNAPGLVRAGLLSQVESGMRDSVSYEVTPLEAALLARRIEVVRLLLRTGADPSRSTRALCLAGSRLPEALPLLGAQVGQAVAANLADCFAPSGR